MQVTHELTPNQRAYLQPRIATWQKFEAEAKKAKDDVVAFWNYVIAEANLPTPKNGWQPTPDGMTLVGEVEATVSEEQDGQAT